MPLPDDVRNNVHICKYTVMKPNEPDLDFALEQYERVPTDKDIPANKETKSRPIFFGEWKDVTPILKAKQEVLKAEAEVRKQRSKYAIPLY